jgi:hypothetical protein
LFCLGRCAAKEKLQERCFLAGQTSGKSLRSARSARSSNTRASIPISWILIFGKKPREPAPHRAQTVRPENHGHHGNLTTKSPDAYRRLVPRNGLAYQSPVNEISAEEMRTPRNKSKLMPDPCDAPRRRVAAVLALCFSLWVLLRDQVTAHRRRGLDLRLFVIPSHRFAAIPCVL